MADPAGAQVLPRRLEARVGWGAPRRAAELKLELKNPTNLAEGVAHKLHRLWDRVKHPACGFVDNASQNFLFG